jgi:hypothetical protein
MHFSIVDLIFVLRIFKSFPLIFSAYDLRKFFTDI